MEIKVGELVFGTDRSYFGIVLEIREDDAKVYWFNSIDGVSRYEENSLHSIAYCRENAKELGWFNGN